MNQIRESALIKVVLEGETSHFIKGEKNSDKTWTYQIGKRKPISLDIGPNFCSKKLARYYLKKGYKKVEIKIY